MLVYLAGPVTGLDFKGAHSWRQRAERRLYELSGGIIYSLSPIRHKDSGVEDITNLGVLKDGNWEHTMLSSQRGIYHRCMNDCRRADLILVNVLDAEVVSKGTVMEIAWGAAWNKPMVLVINKDNPHEHTMIREACPFITPSLDQGILTAYQILCP